jgi:hypothetical protein
VAAAAEPAARGAGERDASAIAARRGEESGKSVRSGGARLLRVRMWWCAGNGGALEGVRCRRAGAHAARRGKGATQRRETAAGVSSGRRARGAAGRDSPRLRAASGSHAPRACASLAACLTRAGSATGATPVCQHQHTLRRPCAGPTLNLAVQGCFSACNAALVSLRLAVVSRSALLTREASRKHL